MQSSDASSTIIHPHHRSQSLTLDLAPMPLLGSYISMKTVIKSTDDAINAMCSHLSTRDAWDGNPIMTGSDATIGNISPCPRPRTVDITSDGPPKFAQVCLETLWALTMSNPGQRPHANDVPNATVVLASPLRIPKPRPMRTLALCVCNRGRCRDTTCIYRYSWDRHRLDRGEADGWCGWVPLKPPKIPLTVTRSRRHFIKPRSDTHHTYSTRTAHAQHTAHNTAHNTQKDGGGWHHRPYHHYDKHDGPFLPCAVWDSNLGSSKTRKRGPSGVGVSGAPNTRIYLLLALDTATTGEAFYRASVSVH
ncbi:uncharacterized protein LY79DRAFT_358796 [Colletotrichum navitas]|uniref:Uncharacterized protein n=1 Tax=Colletotrichum navitas TaxID=681940 RepID=A0AAD8PQU9_9PEZI|nr:uncharacterized protein LY79DRAFT_358796 [Colletotrichum navitas]KAK1574734.1 hypothetical protein LY79DRAFT_358796 [Colletotrichum navitas]